MREPDRFHGLDALRGVAALAVVFWHWQNFFLVGFHPPAGWRAAEQPLYALLRPLYDSGDRAVDLFFALSGFVFYWLYGQRVAEGRLGGMAFFRLRFARLYPLHLLTLLLVAAGQAAHVAAQGRVFVYPDTDAWHFVLHLLLLNGLAPGHAMGFNAPAWSISIEAVLYLLFFWICRRMGLRAWLPPVLALAGFFLLARVHLPLGRGVGSFFLGGCTFLAYRWILGRPEREAWRRGVVAATALLWAVTLACSWAGWSLADQGPTRALHWKYPVLVLFPMTILALALAESAHHGLGRRLAWLGDVSYSSYLWHFPLQLACVLVLPRFVPVPEVFRSPWALLAFLAVLIVVSLASHRWLERPAQAWLRGGRR